MPPPRASQSYPHEQSAASGPPEKPRRSRLPGVHQARILACLAIIGPLRLSDFRSCERLADLTCDEICNALSALVKLGRIQANEQSEIGVVDGMRFRRDYVLFSRIRSGGGEP